MNLFQIKLNELLAPFTGHFTLKVLREVQEAMYDFAEISHRHVFAKSLCWTIWSLMKNQTI